jgi:hypothetical protein
MLKIYEGTWKRRATLWVADHSCRKMSKEAVDVLIHKHSYTCDSCARCDPASRCQHEKTPPGAEKTSCARQSVKTEHVDVWNMWNVWNHPASSNKHIKTCRFCRFVQCVLLCRLFVALHHSPVFCVLHSNSHPESETRQANMSEEDLVNQDSSKLADSANSVVQQPCHTWTPFWVPFCAMPLPWARIQFLVLKDSYNAACSQNSMKEKTIQFPLKIPRFWVQIQIRIDSNCIVAPGLVASLTYCSTWKLSRFSAGLGELQA